MSVVANSRYKLDLGPLPTRRRTATTARTAPDVATFIDQYVIIDDAQDHGDGAGTMPFKLWDAQRDLLGDMERERLLLILKARQLGISWLACAYALWLCMYHPGRVVLAFSKGHDEANELTRRIIVMYERLPDDIKAAHPMTKSNTEEVAWSNGSRVKSMPATPSAGRTFTASLVIMDEAAFMTWAAKLYTALKPTIDGGGKLIILSTANGTDNLFYDLCQRALQGLGRFVFRFLPWQARPGRDAAWYAATEADAVDSALMRQEYPADPAEAFEATDVDTFLPHISLWDACRDDDLPPLDAHTPCVLALDAGESSDTFATVIVSRHPADPARLAVRYVRPYVPERGQPLDFDAIGAEIRALVKAHAVRQIAYDPFLLGQTVRRLTDPKGKHGPIATPCEPFPQGAARLEADKGLLDLIAQRRIAHGGDQDLRQHLANANRKLDAESRKLRIVKRKHALKIDLAVALSMGAQRAGEVLDLTPEPVGPAIMPHVSTWRQS